MADQDVGRLDVPVHQTFFVRGVQRLRDLFQHRHRVRRAHRAVGGEQGADVTSLDQPHVQVEPAVDLAVGVDRDHVRLAETSGRVRLALEAVPELIIGGQVLGQQFEGYDAVVAGVVRAEDLPHPTPRDQSFHQVRTELPLHGAKLLRTDIAVILLGDSQRPGAARTPRIRPPLPVTDGNPPVARCRR